MKSIAVFVLGCLLLLPVIGFADEAFDRQRMQRDLEIMEAVLGKLLQQDNMHLGGGEDRKVRGLYCEGYGVLFLVEQGFNWVGNPGRYVVKFGTSEKDEMVNVHRNVTASLPDGESVEEEEKVRTEDLKNRLTEFLGTYADAVGQLKESDRITVLTEWGGLSSIFAKNGLERYVVKVGKSETSDEDTVRIAFEEKLESVIDEEEVDVVRHRIGPRSGVGMGHLAVLAGRLHGLHEGRGGRGGRFEATVKRSDVTAYRKGSLSKEAFQGRILFREQEQNEDDKKRIEIMSGILEKSLGSEEPVLETRFRLEMQASGMYHEGVGAIFFVRSGSGVNVYYSTREKNEEKDLHFQGRIRDNLVEVLAVYGHTLRSLKPSEQIVVQMEFNDQWNKGLPSRMTVKARKKDVDAYNKGTMDLEAFRRQVEVLSM
ncbi:MAG: hypothetical protein O2954_06105 [bacterium]|nr:hypothetical protein [bacterium]